MHTQHDTFYVRCRGVIINNGKLLVVKHDPSSDYYALPGGHMDIGETVEDCMKRELVEELGVEPKVGRLLYVNVFENRALGKNSLELMFEITNGEDFADIEKIKSYDRSHAFEICDIKFVEIGAGINLLPTFIWDDFISGKLNPRYDFTTKYMYNIKEK